MMRKRTMGSNVPIDYSNGHPYVEIAGIKWATMNLGAESETDYGLYFQWGDTQGYTYSQVGANSVDYKKPFSAADYKFNNGTSTFTANTMTKYNASDEKTTLELCDDAARLSWGGKWRLPSYSEIKSLIDNTTSQWKSNYNGSGVNGRLITDKTDSSKKIFIPAPGTCDNGSRSGAGQYGRYWYRIISSSGKYRAPYLRITNQYFDYTSVRDRYHGLPIRPILDD